jgi:ADP-ribose pyrophosphatase YjhB (NUDIX family)
MGQEYPRQPVPAVAAVVLRSEKKESGDGPVTPCSALLVRRANPPSQGEWSLPGGVLELGETLQAGLVREVREETGIEVGPIAVLEVLDQIVREDVTNGHVDVRIRFHYVLIDFICRVQGGSLASASDALDARWVRRRDIEEGTGFPLPARTRGVIEKAFKLLDDGLELG